MRFSPSNLLRNFMKLLLTAAGTATGAGVAALAKQVFDYDLDATTAIAVAGLLSALAVGFGKANTKLPVRVLSAKTTAEPSMEERASLYGPDYDAEEEKLL